MRRQGAHSAAPWNKATMIHGHLPAAHEDLIFYSLRLPVPDGCLKWLKKQKRPGFNPGLYFPDGVPKGIRTPVAGVKGRCPGPG